VCRKAPSSCTLADFLETPTQTYFLPEEFAGPDLVVALANRTNPETKGFAFFQFKLREKVNKTEALRTTNWKFFYCSRKTKAVLPNCEDRVARVAAAMQSHKATAFSVVVAFPYETDSRPKHRNFRWCGEPELRSIFGDTVVDFLSSLKAAQQLDFHDTCEEGLSE
jgi:hypothetical protein